MSTKHRNENLDFIKALSCFGVVYIHSSSLIIIDGFKLPVSYFRFCVPIFLLSTFFISESQKINQPLLNEIRPPLFYLKKRISRLIIPMIFWSLIYFILSYLFGTPAIDLVRKHLMGEGWAGQYYFFIIIQLSMIYYLLPTYTKSYIFFLPGILIPLSLIFLMYIPLSKFSLINISKQWFGEINHFFAYWIQYLVIGMYLSKAQITKRFNNTLCIILILTIPFILLIEEYLIRKTELTVDPYGRFSVIISSLLIIYFVLQLNIDWNQNKVTRSIRKVFSIISQYSLGIFCLNPLVIILTEKYLLLNYKQLQCPPVLAPMLPLLTTSVVMMICILISYLFKSAGLNKLTT